MNKRQAKKKRDKYIKTLHPTIQFAIYIRDKATKGFERKLRNMILGRE